MVSTSLSRTVGWGPRLRNSRPDKKSSILQNTAIMNVVRFMGDASRFLCLFRNFTNTAVSFSCQDTKICENIPKIAIPMVELYNEASIWRKMIGCFLKQKLSFKIPTSPHSRTLTQALHWK
jgi:hypothetical protein